MEKNIWTNEAVELLKRLIKTPSTSRNETDAADILASFIEEKGIEHQRKGNNIWCISPIYIPQKPTILLNAHIDTVEPASSWTRNPYDPQLENGKLYGLGSNDDGGGLVSLLQTFRILAQKEQPYNLIFLASCEEEISGKKGIEDVLPLLPHVDVAIVGEPTKMEPAIAEKGLMVIDATAHGKAGHAARNEGENAIYKALKDIEWLSTYNFEKKSELLGGVKMTVTIIEGGTRHNVIPDKCTFTIDVRSNELYSNQEIFKVIKEKVLSEVNARSFRLNSSRIDLDHPIVKKILSKGKKPFGSPTLSDQALMRFPSLKMGPGDSARSHTADEYIGLEEINQAILEYVEILDGLVL